MKPARLLLLLAAAATVLDFAAFRAGWIPLDPPLFAGLVGTTMLLLLPEAAHAVADLVARRTGPLRGAGRLAAVLGTLAVGAGGMTNWLYSLQGMAILTEGQTVRLSRTDQLQAFELGPLAKVEELGVELTLVDLAFRPAAGGFFPESRVAIARSGSRPLEVSLAPGRPVASESLRFHQGAFGFAPRIVILGPAGPLFDRVVPFTTRRESGNSLSFAGRFTVEEAGLRVDGSISLDSLDERLRGHPTLEVLLRRGATTLGTGPLTLGHFAELEGGTRVGFTGLERWSEIVVARRNYPEPMIAGAAVALLGAALWGIGRWRSR